MKPKKPYTRKTICKEKAGSLHKPRKPRNMVGTAYLFTDAPWVGFDSDVISNTNTMRKLAAYLIRCADWIEAQQQEGK